MISVFQKIDFFLQLAGYILDERVGGDLGIMPYHLGEVPCETRRLFGRARDVSGRPEPLTESRTAAISSASPERCHVRLAVILTSPVGETCRR